MTSGVCWISLTTRAYSRAADADHGADAVAERAEVHRGAIAGDDAGRLRACARARSPPAGSGARGGRARPSSGARRPAARRGCGCRSGRARCSRRASSKSSSRKHGIARTCAAIPSMSHGRSDASRFIRFERMTHDRLAARLAARRRCRRWSSPAWPPPGWSGARPTSRSSSRCVSFPPFFQMGTRFLVAGALLLAWMRWRARAVARRARNGATRWSSAR